MGTLLGLQNGLASSLLPDLLRPRLWKEDDEDIEEKEGELDEEENEDDAVRLNRVVRPMRCFRWQESERRGVTLPSAGITWREND